MAVAITVIATVAARLEGASEAVEAANFEEECHPGAPEIYPRRIDPRPGTTGGGTETKLLPFPKSKHPFF